MRQVIFLLGIFLLYGCKCRYYHTKEMVSQTPVLIIGAGYRTEVCDIKDGDIRIRIAEEEQSYKVSEDSIGYGYTASIGFYGKKKREGITVGQGSEFQVGKCHFRVIKVFSPWDWDTVTSPDGKHEIHLHKALAVQLLKAPPRCICANQSLKKYEAVGLDPKWLEKIYAERWKHRVSKK